MACVRAPMMSRVRRVTMAMMMVCPHHIPIIALPLFRVGQNAVGLAYLRETFAGIGVAAIDVRVRLFGKCIKLLLQFGLRDMLADSEHFVVVRGMAVGVKGG